MQVGLSVVLATAAWAMTSHAARLQRADPGFAVDDILTARVGAPLSRFGSLEERHRFVARVMESVRAVPGVQAVGAASAVPIGDNVVTWSFSIEGRQPASQGEMFASIGRLTLPGYLETLDIPLLEGRLLEPTDDERAPGVVVVNRAFRDAFLAPGAAVGRRIKRRTYDSPFPWLTVMGVVENAREVDPGDDFVPTIYFSYAQHLTPAGETVTLVVRTSPAVADLPRRIERIVADIDPDAAVFRVLTMEDRIVEATGQRRLGAVLLGAFGGLGILVSLVGVYGVMAEGVQGRRRELAIRMAMGATGQSIVGVLLRHTVALAACGILGGVAVLGVLAPRAHRALSGLEADPVTIATIALLTLAITLAAALPPIVRAARGDVLAPLTRE